MLEIWKPIDGYEHRYEISNTGKVRNSNYYGRGISYELKLNTNLGYKRIFLKNKKTRKRFLIHRLVAKAFIPNPENKPQVNHINGIRDDNRVENLEWCTVSENCLHAYKVLNRVPAGGAKKGDLNKNSREINQYDMDGKFIKTHSSLSNAAMSIGYKFTGNIYTNCIGKIRYCKGYIRKFKS